MKKETLRSIDDTHNGNFGVFNSGTSVCYRQRKPEKLPYDYLVY